MSVVFNHAIRHQVHSRNPIRLVRQSAKRRKIPVVLSASEVQQLLEALALLANFEPKGAVARQYGAYRVSVP